MMAAAFEREACRCGGNGFAKAQEERNGKENQGDVLHWHEYDGKGDGKHRIQNEIGRAHV